ncbi:unnamed protein product [Miscanthus lutarioriparius]|uniref:Uncharacterized protein n=1 Tax=Miscanthus lutarioriparius TaxID=422564 RepID=A0A811RG21_9POAL|nr:unnamed protein product [Miscanthus lutarioriparius]
MIVFPEDCDRDLKRKEMMASSESGDGALNKERDSLLKEGEILKLRKEFWEEEELWKDGLVPGALDRWLESESKNKTTQVPQKKRKVVRIAVPDAYIHFIMENPTLMRWPNVPRINARCMPFRSSSMLRTARIRKPSLISTRLLALPMTKRRSQMMTDEKEKN